MNIKEKVYAALMSSPELKALLVKDRKGRCIYPGVSPNAGSYPILVYNIISDVPALVADGEEMERLIFLQVLFVQHKTTNETNYNRNVIVYSFLF